MANHYRSVLESGGVQPTGNAVAADVLTGKTFSNASAVGIAGSMPNNGAVSGTATPSQPYRIPAGYHNGSGVVSASASYNIVDYITAQIQDSTANKKIYTATQNVNVVANFHMLDMGELVGGKVALYNSSGTKLQDLFIKEYSTGGGTPVNISFSMSSGDYIECYDMIAQTTPGYAYILAALFALT